MTVLTTERLILRDWTDDPADLARIFAIYSRADVTRFLGAPGLPMTDPAQAAERLRIWQERHAADGGRYGTWAMEVRETGSGGRHGAAQAAAGAG
ncbi:GNAT family N-acetyltransferase [Micromonospora sp. NPDC049645]|uniref:GNAT family N-acetyltransferase n=1 Tax=Micromonospora sp. NPDC049645 TaxID=3155508 RepID=UPI00344A34CE